jgi:imidazoleglycerol-phosphate dehydratase
MRNAKLSRKTKETSITVELGLDGKGGYKIKTPVSFLNHMLELFSKHGLFDLKLAAKGDTEVDDHHIVEDIGICLGMALKKALGSKKGIERYGYCLLPMDETLTEVCLDISGRPYLVFNVAFGRNLKKGGFDFNLLEEFFRAICYNAGLTLHVTLKYGKNNHHIAESIFKGFSKALSGAVRINRRVKGIPSSKGTL